MRLHGIVGREKCRYRTTIPAVSKIQVPDLVSGDFAVGVPDRRRPDDITYLRTGESRLFLATVLDLGSRRLLGYSIADHMRAELVRDALGMAVDTRGGRLEVEIVFHSDRGSQYLSRDYANAGNAYGVAQSVGRTGVCWNKTVAEAFFASLKRETIHDRHFTTRTEARRHVFAWPNWYNTTRLHSSLGYTTPIEWETTHQQNLTMVASPSIRQQGPPTTPGRERARGPLKQ